MFNNLIIYLDKNKIQHAVLEENKVVTFSTRTENGNFQCIADVDETINTFLFYTMLGIFIPESKRLIVCELLARINYGIIIGNFEMDMDDGEIRYKTSIDYEGSELTDKNIDNIMSANLSMVDNYLFSILESISSQLPAKEILSKYENIDTEEVE